MELLGIERIGQAVASTFLCLLFGWGVLCPGEVTAMAGSATNTPTCATVRSSASITDRDAAPVDVKRRAAAEIHRASSSGRTTS